MGWLSMELIVFGLVKFVRIDMVSATVHVYAFVGEGIGAMHAQLLLYAATQ